MAEASTLPQRKLSSSCSNFPDFASVCLFIEQFGEILGLLPLSIGSLREGFEEESEDVSDFIRDLHVYLLRRIKKNIPADRWERELVKFCTSYNHWHAWELEEQGYAKLKLSTRLAIIRNLLEAQFDANLKFQERLKTDIPEEELRRQCYGRDKGGLCYWLVQDEELSINIFRVEQDDTDGSSWQIVAKDRDELSMLIECLKEDKPIPCVTALEQDRSGTPVSMLSSHTGTGINPSRTATPTKFAFDRSHTATPVKSGLAKEEMKECDVTKVESDTIKQEVPLASDSKSVDSATAVEYKANISLKTEEAMETDPNKMDSETNGEETKIEEQTSSQIDMQTDGGDTKEKVEITPEEAATQVEGESAQTVEKKEQVSSEQTSVTEPAEPGTSMASSIGIATPQQMESVEKRDSSDSEDNIPLSQLKKTCVLLNKARKSLLKAKKQHEKKKYKEMVKKQKEKTKKRLKLADDADSPKASPMRTSGRQRKPVFTNLSDGDNSHSSLSDDDEYIPKQGRNARRQAKRTGGVVITTHEELSSEVDNEDTPCSSCGKYNQPHLLLLCDKCDSGWHTGCVKPPLFYIPEGDWHCPTCEHTLLIEKLSTQLEKLDELIKSEEAKKKRQERQEKYALSNGIHSSNIISSYDAPPKQKRLPPERHSYKYDAYDYDSYEEDHYVPSKRSCRQRTKVNYKFEEYEALINSAIRNQAKEGDPTLLPGTNSSLVASAPPPGRSRGKDISNLLGGASVTSSEEEEEEGESDRKEGGKGKGKENRVRRKRTTKLNDIDAESGGEADEDYDADEAASNEEEDEEDNQSGDTEESISDDAWTPSRSRKRTGSGRRRQGTRRRSGRRSLDDVKGFICDDEDESDGGRRRQRRAPPRRSTTRKSASASQAAVRAKRAKFGFTSSEESLATTPCSSSSEEEHKAATRVVNKWNTIKTYSNSEASKSKSSPKKKKKKKRVKEDYNSDASTEQEECSSAEEYVPASGGEEKQETEPEENNVQESDGDKSTEEGVHRVNNRLESSSEEDVGGDNEKIGKDHTDNKLNPNHVMENSMETQPTDTVTNNKDTVPPGTNPTSTGDSTGIKSSTTNSITSSTTLPSTAALTSTVTSSEVSQALCTTNTTSAANVSTVSSNDPEVVKQSSKLSPMINQSSETDEKEEVKRQPLHTIKQTSTDITKPASSQGIPSKGSKAPRLSAAPVPTTSIAVTSTHVSGSYIAPAPINHITSIRMTTPVNSNNSNNTPYFSQTGQGSPQVPQPRPVYPRYSQQPPAFPSQQPGHSPVTQYQYHRYPSNSSSPNRPVNGQPPPGYFQQRPQYHPHSGMSWRPNPYLQYPPTGANNTAYGVPYPPPSHSLPVNMQAPALHSQPPVMHQPPPSAPEQSRPSNAFMVDSLLQSSQSKGNTYEPASSSVVAGIGEEEDDEMSSYMAMASSMVAGGSDKT